MKVEDYENNVGFSERADVPIEPRISMQWFLTYPCTAEAAEAGLIDGRQQGLGYLAGRAIIGFRFGIRVGAGLNLHCDGHVI